MRTSRNAPRSDPERPSQELPADLVADILGVIRGQFYGDLPPKKFFQDQRLLLSLVVLWPATWLRERGWTLKPGRYKAILLEIIQDVKRNGDTVNVEFWPRYLCHCVQTWFRHNEDAVHKEAKSIQLAIDRAMTAFSRAQPVATADDQIRALAAARDAIKTTSKPRPKRSDAPLLPGF